MHLKSLTLRGFKSFASATTLRFEPGITCVVGPNGSGKSNVVDALAWVMGEQGAKSLRGGKMEDVIFAGTSSRAPLGRAEVSLTIDNTDGALPIDYSEVTVSRLMFRAGTSEYAINGDSCRLLDVQELLSDTGIGREMHLIVGQGQLDTVLGAGPEERRALIEEAAGVLKHRKRKEKALRKLEAMQANLTRLTDLTAELRRQLKPLGRQAELARRAAAIQADLRDAKLRLLADDLLGLRTKIEREEADEAQVRDRRTEVERALAEATQREGALEADAQAAAPELAAAQRTWYELSSLLDRLLGLGELATERHRHLSEQAVQEYHGRDPVELEREAAEARQTQQRLRTELAEASAVLETIGAEREQAEEALRIEEQRLADVAKSAAQHREGLATLRGQRDALHSRLTAAQDEIGRLDAAAQQAAERAEEAEAELHRLGEQEAPDEDDDAAQAAYEQASAHVDSASASEEEAGDAVAAARDALAAARGRHQDAQREQAALAARKETLELGLTRADQAGETLRDEGRVRGVVAPLIEVTPGTETAVAAALGDIAEAIIVDGVAGAVEALELLKRRDAGRATLLVGEGSAAPATERPSLGDGAVYAADCVRAPSELAAVLHRLLADVAVVDDLPAARELVRRFPELRAVTKDGDLVGRDLARGGAARPPSQIELQASVDDAAQQLAAIGERCEHAAAEVAAAEEAERAAAESAAAWNAEVKRARQAVKEHESALRQVRTREAERAKQRERLGAAARAAREEEERLRRAVVDARGARETGLAELAEMEERLAAAETQERPDGDDDTDERDRLAARCAQAREAEMDARLNVRTAEERVTAIAGRAEALDRAAAEEREARQRAARERHWRREQAKVAAAVVTGVEHTVERIRVSLERAKTEWDAARTAGEARDAELKQLRARVRELSAQAEKLVNAVHGSEVTRAEQRLRLEQLENQAVEEMGVDAATLIAEYGPEVPIPAVDADALPIPYVRQEQEKRAKAAQRQLNQLGKVNPLALEEYAALEERHTFLSSQLEDLKKTRRDLLTVVKEVDDRVQQVFGAAYADVEREFGRVFGRLFPGGEGRLTLTEPDDMLTTGVEIEARPPGKKVKRLSLLSGGERSLTAIAFLIAIFMARPSPFYVLDEVEAALDDTNLQRLLVILEELRERSQLLVITHQKRTMEAADALYGVSMQDDGVSAVISQRLREPEAV